MQRTNIHSHLRMAVVATVSAAGLMTGQVMAENKPAQGSGDKAATNQAPSMKAGKSSTAARPLDMRASRLIGMDVHNLQGEDLGEINDLMIDVNNQRVHYAILGFGGYLGVGEKLFAYPVRSLRASGDRLILDASKEHLEKAPGFDRSLWPNWAELRNREAIDRYHGPSVAPDRVENVRLVRASELIGRDVEDTKGDDAGEIEDLVVDLGTTRVRYAVLDFDEAWSAEDKLLALPLSTLRMPAENVGEAVLQVPRDKLNMSQGFDEDNWPALNDPQYRDRVNRQLPAYQPWAWTPATNASTARN